VLVVIFLLLEAIEPTRLFLNRRVFELDQESLIGIVALVLGVNFLAMRQMAEHVGSVRARLEKVPEMEILQDHSRVYPYLRDLLINPPPGHARKLEVLGLTLYSAWPQLSVWLIGEELRDWEITLYSLSPSYIRDHADILAKDWAEEAEIIQEQIRKFPNVLKVLNLTDRRLKLELNCYSSFPGIHGFRIGQELFVSFAHWSGDQDGLILRPYQFYEHFAASDTSIRASKYRDLFDNWITRAADTSEGHAADVIPTVAKSGSHVESKNSTSSTQTGSETPSMQS
jgi:hypothetical protein